MMRLLLSALVGFLWSSVATASEFRNAGVAYEGHSPAQWKALTDATWKVPTSSWSNSSPVMFAGMVCGLSEPTTVWCLDAATGRTRWTATNDYSDTLSADERVSFAARREQAVVAEKDVAGLQAQYGAARRALRAAPGDAAITAQIAALSSKLASARALVDGFAPFLTPPNREIIGYTTHTPASDSARLYVLTGNGVVSAFDPSGKRLWSRWAGPAAKPPRGYMVGSGASLVVVDGMLIVPHAQLLALDPATGRELWRSVPYADFGTPAVAHVGHTTVLLTPSGELVRAVDGYVLSKGLGDLWFAGPQVIGNDVFYVGGHAEHQIETGQPLHAVSWRLAEVGPGDVRATKRWDQILPTKEPLYTSPAFAAGALFSVDRGANVWRIDPATGAVTDLGTVLGKQALGLVYSSPVSVDGSLWISSESGALGVITPQGQAKDMGVWEPLRSTLVFDRDRLFVRTLDHVLCFGGAK
jgi:outer membrane protein assembly factor BamB